MDPESPVLLTVDWPPPVSTESPESFEAVKFREQQRREVERRLGLPYHLFGETRQQRLRRRGVMIVYDR